ncbi:unnamed protein product [Allacma fusca]|uniref:Uncharacterized protein n=1 Tax=Allacma fusca TaxID=39272 RepID=A0A8J2K2V2_9HEXA|nr:unnamed protein product [Allacma fusca]
MGGCPEKIVKSNKVTVCNNGAQPSTVQTKKSQASNVQLSKKYIFPIKRLLLHRDPKDKSVGGMGLGMKIVGGKEIPDSNGRIAAYVAKIYSGGVTDTLGDIQEGDIVLEWNGTSLDDKTFEEVQSIVGSSDGEIEVVLRSDFDILTGKPRPRDNRLGEHQSLRQRRHSNCPQQGEMSSSGAGCRIPQENYKCEVPLSDPDREYQDSRTSHGPDRDCGVPRKERFLPNLAKSPSSSTENTSVATSSIHQSVITDERSLRTAAFVQSGNYGLSSESRRPSIPRTPKDPSILSMDTGSEHLLSSNNSSSVYSPLLTNQRSGHRTSGKRSSSNGHVQLQTCHDPKANILYVTVLKAKLPKQQNDDGTDHVQVDPYIVVYLLPERILENQRRTRHVPMCSSPQWNQTMVYPGVALVDLKTKLLEVSAWNYNPTGDDDFLGKVTLDLSEEGILDEQPHSYGLKRDEKPSRRRSGQSLSKVVNPGGRHGRLSDGNSGKCSAVDQRVLGRMSIFSPTTIPAQTSMPTDCHAALCIIL